jgi:hypothetical protein
MSIYAKLKLPRRNPKPTSRASGGCTLTSPLGFWLFVKLHKEATPRRIDIMGIYDFMLCMVIIMIIVLSLKK